MMNKLLQGVALAFTLVVSGCVSVLPEAAPAKPRFNIAAADSTLLAGEALAFSLVIDDPRATRVYDSVRIAVSTAPGRIEYLGVAEWADRAPRLFQTAMVQTFEDAGRILAVGDRAAIPVADFVLQTDIRHMQLDVQGRENAAQVTVYARLTDGKGTVFAAKKFEAHIVAGSTKADDVYTAFDSAFDQIISGIVGWTFEAGETARDGA